MKYSVLERLAILNEVKETGNVSEVCRKFNISRTQFYQYKKRFANQGMLGLVNNPPLKIHIQKKYGDEVTEQILSLVIQRPAISCASIAKKLKQDGVILSSMGVFKILKKHQLENKIKRQQMLEKKIKTREIKNLSVSQRIFLSSVNPYFAYYKTNKNPVKHFSQDIIIIKNNNRNLYLYLVVDIFSNYIFAILEASKDPQHLVKVLKQAIRFLDVFENDSIIIRTSELNIFQGKQDCPYQQFLQANKITQQKLFVRPDYDECMMDFAVQIKKLLTNDEDSLLMLKQKMQYYLLRHNHNYRYKYYPYYGKPPIKMLKSHLDKKNLWNRAKPFLNTNYNFISPPLLANGKKKLDYQKRLISLVSTLCSYKLFQK